MLKTLIFLSMALFSPDLIGQVDSIAKKTSLPKVNSESPSNPVPEVLEGKVYKTHPGWEIPVSLAFIGASSLGYKEMDKVASLTAEQALALDPMSINAFDRPAAYYDPAGFSSANATSDILMPIVAVSPVFLLFDKKIRRDWADMLSMLLVAQAVDNTILFSSFLAVRRPRPISYNPAADIEDRIGVGKTNSFFSGHVSWAATSTFFIVKVYTDYHHIKGFKRVALYTAAAIPPLAVGYYRVQAGRHFASDALVGLATGALCGILVPELHRIKKKNIGLSIEPFSRYGASGFTLTRKIGWKTPHLPAPTL